MRGMMGGMGVGIDEEGFARMRMDFMIPGAPKFLLLSASREGTSLFSFFIFLRGGKFNKQINERFGAMARILKLG